MNREQAKQLLSIIQAFADGADVQYRSDFGWTTATSPAFSVPGEWRIKPKPVEAWAVIDAKGEMRGGGAFSTLKDAEEFVENSFDSRRKPFRIALLREVTE